MSPIPPNKESNQTNFNDSINNNDPLDNSNNLPQDTQENEFEIINEANDETRNHNHNYVPISQNQSETINNQDQANVNDEDDFDFESDSDSEIDPDEGFEMLASSRAFTSNERTNTNYDRNQHLFESDIFERKNILECEEIHLDETKSKEINNLMSNFKLPDSSVPEWAKLVPEDVWKKNLIDSLNAKKTDLFDLPKMN